MALGLAGRRLKSICARRGDAEIRLDVSRAMQSRFSEDLTTRCRGGGGGGGSGYRPGARRSIS